MPRLVLTDVRGKQHSALLVSTASAQRPNEIQMHQLDLINRRLPSEILAAMAERRLALAPREFDLLLARLSKGADLKISIED
jgi:hypothetical protein